MEKSIYSFTSYISNTAGYQILEIVLSIVFGLALVFLYIRRERVPEPESTVVRAHVDLCLAREFFFHFYFFCTSEFHVYLTLFLFPICVSCTLCMHYFNKNRTCHILLEVTSFLLLFSFSFIKVHGLY